MSVMVITDITVISSIMVSVIVITKILRASVVSNGHHRDIKINMVSVMVITVLQTAWCQRWASQNAIKHHGVRGGHIRDIKQEGVSSGHHKIISIILLSAKEGHYKVILSRIMRTVSEVVVTK